MFGVLILCGFGLPMPEDIVLITGGILSARGVTNIWVTDVVCLAGVLLGDGAVFTIGRVYGHRVTNWRLFRWILTEERNRSVQKVFDKYGDKVVFIARFLPGLRTPIFLSAGRFGVPAWKFVSLDGLAALISVPVWIRVGHAFGDNLEGLADNLHRYQAAVIGAILGAILLFVGFYFLKKRLVES